ncbi:NAD-dependent succinate-semialdehyde dehydrogenase [Gordonia polyisoprenivorans]|uniref:NAD-dependent succinate-semialdehyde dehydrogenase n=1 Tax=Gordonia polyisoprenivorans TaxID=84595 RepID=UPI0019F36F8A|nr:NAD-dependent succinate-semialdehyde dehydrogenase [Gordonia polyisoprenivorans]UZF55442.1 NAD-dependent succinate-semialdehyde dehydrogenase [Gordonia polyisoprenivorans]
MSVTPTAPTTPDPDHADAEQRYRQRLLDRIPRGLLIGGVWRSSADDKVVTVENPATGASLGPVASATVADGDAALTAATDVANTWKATPPRERGEILRRAFELLTDRAEDFATLMTLEMGKPLPQARAEVTYGAEFLRWYAEEAVRIDGRWSTAPDGRTRLLTMRQGVGPVLAITPWNFPLAMGTRKIGPALAAGCTMVIKPAIQTPLTMLALADLLTEAGVPAGVVNVITTASSSTVIAPLISDARLRKLTFTGSTPVGKALIRQSADQVLRVSMELGGNAPFLVFADADLDAAVEGAMLAKMRNMGEACTAANRFLVHESVASEFGRLLAARMEQEIVGDGLRPEVTVGPLIDNEQRSKVAELVTDAVDRGAQILTGGDAIEGAGYFYSPTVLTDIAPDTALLREEIFGPVAPITTFTSDAQAIGLANDTEYGLAAYAFTDHIDHAIAVSEALDFGMVGLNQGIVSNAAAPFGGMKQSGFGREGGPEGIEEYLETKYVGISTRPGL